MPKKNESSSGKKKLNANNNMFQMEVLIYEVN